MKGNYNMSLQFLYQKTTKIINKARKWTKRKLVWNQKSFIILNFRVICGMVSKTGNNKEVRNTCGPLKAKHYSGIFRWKHGIANEARFNEEMHILHVSNQTTPNQNKPIDQTPTNHEKAYQPKKKNLKTLVCLCNILVRKE